MRWFGAQLGGKNGQGLSQVSSVSAIFIMSTSDGQRPLSKYFSRFFFSGVFCHSDQRRRPALGCMRQPDSGRRLKSNTSCEREKSLLIQASRRGSEENQTHHPEHNRPKCSFNQKPSIHCPLSRTRPTSCFFRSALYF